MKLTREDVESLLAECDRPYGAAQFTHQASIDLARELLAAWDREAKLAAVVKYIARFGPDEDSQSQCRFALKSIGDTT